MAILAIFIVIFAGGCASLTFDNVPALTETSMLTHTSSSSVPASPSLTITALPGPIEVSPTVMPSPTGPPTQVPLTATVTPAVSLTPMDPGPTPQPTSTCVEPPEGVFLTIWQGNPDFRAALGCPTSYHPRIEPAAWEVETAYQSFEHGAMVWSNQIGWFDQPVVYVLYADGTYANGTFQRVEDTFDRAIDPVAGDETPPQGLYEPILGFGKVWREQPGVREALGWAIGEERPGAGRFQIFEGGAMIWLSQRGETYVFFGDHYVIVDSPTFS